MSIKLLFKKIIQNSLLLSNLSAFFLYPFYRNKNWINEPLEYFVKGNLPYNKKIYQIKKDLFISKYHYKTLPSEYFLYNFPLLNDYGKKQFVGEIEVAESFKKIGTSKTALLFRNKYQCYKFFGKYYNRDVIQLPSNDGLSLFNDFLSRNKKFVVKPIDQSCGRGVYIINIETETCTSRELYERIIKNGDCVVEGYIAQVKEMACWHPDSVNTIRIVTFTNDQKVCILFSVLRIGRNGKCVDNGGSGGILASVDLETGIVSSNGVTEDNEEYICHPNSGIQITGFKVPLWKNAIDLVTELSLLVPEQPLVGWDLALTDKGWIMVEGNRIPSFMIKQITDKKGLRYLMNKLL